ncbi:MAG: hypothetical protein E6G57_07390 [Actinobacteria bacterium]|nr:MAG: hypothetical protein E6G57_07390 [Actinomycetota bacterium]
MPLIDLAVHLRIAGALLLCVASSHLVLPRMLGWSTELQSVSLLTRQVSYVHTYFIGLMCALFGLAATLLADDLVVRDRMTTAVLIGAVAVWGSRLVAQLCVFDSSLWRGRAQTVLGHIAFVVLWTYETGVFVWALARQL